MQTQAQGNEKFSISCVGACACVCVVVVHTSICLCLRLRLRRSCEPALTLLRQYGSELSLSTLWWTWSSGSLFSRKRKWGILTMRLSCSSCASNLLTFLKILFYFFFYIINKQGDDDPWPSNVTIGWTWKCVLEESHNFLAWELFGQLKPNVIGKP